MVFNQKFQNFFIHYGLWICTSALWLAIGVYIYLGSYSRYMADDYCETMRVTTAANPVAAVIERYTSDNWPRASMRYSNLLLTGISEELGRYRMQITMPVMILFWAVGLTLCVRAVRKLFAISIPIQADWFAGGLLAFFSILLAPNVFQILYWRSAMMTHFAPLVFGTFLVTLMLNQVSAAKNLSLLNYVSVFVFTFVIAGFSEPPAAVMVTVFSLLITAIFVWDKSPHKQARIILFASGLLGAGLGIITMLSSPAITPVQRDASVNFAVIILNSFIYSFQFLVNIFRISPLPLSLSLVLPFLAVWLYQQTLSAPQNKKEVIVNLLILPFLLWLLVAASFAPSVYGQGFPVERARFLGSTLLVIAMITTGILLGLLSSSWKLPVKYAFLQWVFLGVFVLLGTSYPIRRALVLLTESVPEYHQRADYWDRREALIMRKAASGETDLIIPGFSGIYGVKELDDRPNFWFNRCAAQIYGVNSIRTISYDPQSLEQLLNE